MNKCEMKDTKKCCICGQEIIGYGNNAQPVADGDCCDDCNISTVIPARLDMMKKQRVDDMDDTADMLTDDFSDAKKADIIECYRRLSGLNESMKIDTDHFDEWALGVTSRRLCCGVEDIKKCLSEETIGQAAAKMDADIEKVKSEGQIEHILDRSLTIAKRKQAKGKKGDYPNVLLIGSAGTAKSSVVRYWAKQNGVNLFEVRASGMDATDLGGAVAPSTDYKTAVRLATTEFDALNKPNSVLFLDEYNRAPQEVRTNLLELVNSHVVPDARDDSGQRFLPNFLFTVAAINPSDGRYSTTAMDPAEKSRFKKVDITFDPLYFWKYIEREYTNDLKSATDDDEKLELTRKLALAKKLLLSKRFEFDTAEDERKGNRELGDAYSPLNYRSLKLLLDDCDGTKEDFLDQWSSICNPLKKNTVEDILSDYQDVDDKANDVLKQDSDSQVFKSKKSNSSALFDKYPELKN